MTEALHIANCFNLQGKQHRYAFVDLEVGIKDKKIHDIGAVRDDSAVYHGVSKSELFEFIRDVRYICGHNIIHHDFNFLFNNEECRWIPVDTLYFSPLLFPRRPYHRLVKDDKLYSDQLNNPVNDCRNARDLFFDEISQWNSLTDEKRRLFAALLKNELEFSGFLHFVGAECSEQDPSRLIRRIYAGKICRNAAIEHFINISPVALAYALALIDSDDYHSVTPRWVLYNFPEVEHIMKCLRHVRCSEGCEYCDTHLNIHYNLKRFFGFDRFRTYEGEPLQEQAARAAVNGHSLLAIFPTGGGKSLTFQLPAMMAGQAVHGLTVIISPLQSLMKDQVDSLAERGITDAITINGLLDPISRAEAIERVCSGDASMLYISPEMLRSRTIERLLLSRNVVRFVIDEAHCFSSWGQDFRVDYLYIGKFIKRYQEKKWCKQPIAVSCFTATAKQKVIQDICDYFKSMLNLELNLFTSRASRTNLQYSVIHVDGDAEKYHKLRELISETDCPTIVYVSRTGRTFKLADELTRDGFKALPYNGKMAPDDKIANQDDFMSDRVRIIVATSAFGMGVDKKDVGLVVHYDISDSLENYVQEAGRAGRDPSLSARCFVLYNENDLDKHFILLNQTKLSISEIQQVWRAVKQLTKTRPAVNCSALEIARQAGWDDTVTDLETRVRTAVASLEQGNYLERGDNMPHVYATGISVKNVDEARARVSASALFGTEEIENAVRVIKLLISQKNTHKSRDAEAESRVDYIADTLGLKKSEVVSVVERMRVEGILEDSREISAYLMDDGDSRKKSLAIFEHFARLERFIENHLPDGKLETSCKQLNEEAIRNGVTESSEKDIRTLLYFWAIKKYVEKKEDGRHNLTIERLISADAMVGRMNRRLEICRLTVNWLYEQICADDSKHLVPFSITELFNRAKISLVSLFRHEVEITLDEVEEALLYLSRIGALKLEGGFLVLYNAMRIKRLKESRSQYKKDDYQLLEKFYELKKQQIHIVGEYADLMVHDISEAQNFVSDYFQTDYRQFLRKYFKGKRYEEICRNLTPQKYNALYGDLSERQKQIIDDSESKYIVVAAGPGSGKTRVLVHKLASLLQLEDVKHEQLLMLTFSRAATTEFKQRLMKLVGNAAHFVEIRTFHSYCFDLLGRIGNLDDAHDVVAEAAVKINLGEVEQNRITKTVLVIDEAQDMGEAEYSLLEALMAHNENMRIIAVGDDDQNIYGFRGSDSKYMYRLSQQPGSRLYEMTDNFRSMSNPVAFANGFLSRIDGRIKSSPIRSMSHEAGWVEITRHQSEIMYEPLVEKLRRNRISGESTCVLTQTNDEAVIVAALLRARGVECKLIQDMRKDMRFFNLAEIRFFLKKISENLTHIPDDVWQSAQKATFSRYSGSESLHYVKRCLDLFEQTNKVLYRGDLIEFIFESSIEDFSEYLDSDVVVSTIHKAKGREFDNVYMMIAGGNTADNNLMRKYYVGLTRAKKQLFIHTDTGYFDRIDVDKYSYDQNQYSLPDEIMLQLTHKDVVLDYFKDKKKEITSMKSGDILNYVDSFLLNPATNNRIVKLSKIMREKISGWEERGYKVRSAKVRFVVAWKQKDAPRNEPTTAVILADLFLSSKA